MKNRRVSGCLHDIHPIQSMQSSHSSGKASRLSQAHCPNRLLWGLGKSFHFLAAVFPL